MNRALSKLLQSNHQLLRPQEGFGAIDMEEWIMTLDMVDERRRALHSPTSLCRLYIDYRESTGSPLGVEWEWSGSAHLDHVDGRST